MACLFIHDLSMSTGYCLAQLPVYLSVADPGFSRGGGRKPPGEAPGYDFIKFSRKLHEIEKYLVARGRARRGCPP